MFRYFEMAEHEFLRSMGLTHEVIHNLGIDIPRVHVECNYTAPITYDEILDIDVSFGRVGKSSVTLNYMAMLENGVVAAKGKVTFCAVELSSGRAIGLPKQIRDVFRVAELSD